MKSLFFIRTTRIVYVRSSLQGSYGFSRGVSETHGLEDCWGSSTSMLFASATLWWCSRLPFVFPSDRFAPVKSGVSLSSNSSLVLHLLCLLQALCSRHSALIDDWQMLPSINKRIWLHDFVFSKNEFSAITATYSLLYYYYMQYI